MKMEFTDMKEIIRHKIKHNLKRIETSIKWVLFAIISGVVAGGAGTLFYFGMTLVTLIRTKHPWLIFLLPFGGLVIVGCYRLLHDEHDTGTNLVISAIHSDDNLPLKMAPLIFISTLITHLFGGSAGREGDALQLGGSIGNGIGKLFHFDDKDKHIMIMCGMSACFSALFGMPRQAGRKLELARRRWVRHCRAGQAHSGGVRRVLPYITGPETRSVFSSLTKM